MSAKAPVGFGFRPRHFGFDDEPDASASNPALTTVAQPTEEKGRVAARILFENGPPRQVVLPVTLKIRSSTAPPPG